MNARYDAFIGRWVVFHNGHLEMIKQVYNKNKRPVLILIMDTDEVPYAVYRLNQIKHILDKENVPCQFTIIPPISSINWGRGVGYETNYIQVDEEIQKISGTKIRQKKTEGDESWKNEVPQ